MLSAYRLLNLPILSITLVLSATQAQSPVRLLKEYHNQLPRKIAVALVIGNPACPPIERINPLLDDKEAERLYLQPIQAEPKSADDYINLGNLNINKKNYEEAEGLYKKAIEIDPKNSLAYNNLGNLNYDIKKNYKEAERFFRQAIEMDPKNAVFHANLALNLYHQNRRDEALTEAKRAKELGLTDHPVYKLLGL